MTNLRLALLILLGVEIIIGAGGWMLRYPALVPPMPNMDGYNAYTAQQLRQLHASCDPTLADNWMNLSDAYIAHGFYPEAEACARMAVQIAPQDADFRFRWAFVLSAMGRLEESVPQFRASLELGHPEPEAVHYLVGREYLRAENTEQAAVELQSSEPLPAAMYELAKLDLRSGKPAEAIVRLKQIEAELPNVYAPHLLRAQAEEQLGHADVAADYRLLSQLNKERLPTPLDEFRIRYLKQIGRYSLSELVQEKLTQVEGNQARQVAAELELMSTGGFEPQLEDLRATVDYALGDRSGQQRRLRKIIDQDGASTYRCWRLAMAYAEDEQYDQAIEWLKTGLRLDSRDSVRESREQLIELYEKTGDLGRARFHVGRLFYWEGLEALSAADLALARQKLATATEIDPSYDAGWYYLGIVVGLWGAPQGQAEAFEKCLAANPYHGRARAWLTAYGEER